MHGLITIHRPNTLQRNPVFLFKSSHELIYCTPGETCCLDA